MPANFMNRLWPSRRLVNYKGNRLRRYPKQVLNFDSGGRFSNIDSDESELKLLMTEVSFCIRSRPWAREGYNCTHSVWLFARFSTQETSWNLSDCSLQSNNYLEFRRWGTSYNKYEEISDNLRTTWSSPYLMSLRVRQTVVKFFIFTITKVEPKRSVWKRCSLQTQGSKRTRHSSVNVTLYLFCRGLYFQYTEDFVLLVLWDFNCLKVFR